MEQVSDLVADILDVVDAIPPGRVMTYGDIAGLLGRGGPRQVGATMSSWGGSVAWWRVLKADGSPPPGHEREALEHYRSEGTPLRSDGARVDLRNARWTPAFLPTGPPAEPSGESPVGTSAWMSGEMSGERSAELSDGRGGIDG
jgi:alkylated DNA nucleotide flippase Atl1